MMMTTTMSYANSDDYHDNNMIVEGGHAVLYDSNVCQPARFIDSLTVCWAECACSPLQKQNR